MQISTINLCRHFEGRLRTDGDADSGPWKCDATQGWEGWGKDSRSRRCKGTRWRTRPHACIVWELGLGVGT